LGNGGSENLIPWGDDVNDESISLVENLIVSVSIDYRLHFDKQQQQQKSRENTRNTTKLFKKTFLNGLPELFHCS